MMRPLISGAEAKHYLEPQTETWLMFPYLLAEDQVRLLSAEEIEASYPKAWAYLRSYEDTLRRREQGRDARGHTVRPFDDDTWYRFGRNQNLDKQHLPKLIVAQAVPSMRVCFDSGGAFALNNVRVNGILPAKGTDPWFLLGILNSPVADWVFRLIAKPKDGGWFEANKQFIAPLPIPVGTAAQSAIVSARARELQRLYTLRRDLLGRIARRLDTVARLTKADTWLFPGLTPPHAREASAPAKLDAAGRRAWARAAYTTELAALEDALGAAVRPGAILAAELEAGELRFLADRRPIVDRAFVSNPDGKFLLAQWKVTATTFPTPNAVDGKKLSKALRSLALPDIVVVVDQVVVAVDDLETCEAAIRTEEQTMNNTVCRLYGLTAAEKAMIGLHA